MAEMLLQTKLFRPSHPSGQRPFHIPRTHLYQKLEAGLTCKVTLVSAPAGFGKTTMVVNWLDILQHEQQTAVGWLSLDENDNDPARFLAYLVAALQTAEPAVGEKAWYLLQSPQPVPPETLLTLLINDISRQDQAIILVLDDYHVITAPAIHQTMAFLLDHLPAQLHLLIACRSDPPLPLSRLRARRQMVEIRSADLRFSLDEVKLFFSQIDGLTLSSEEMSTLEQRTEGWIAGLQLAALSMQGHSSLPDFIATFTGSHRFILDYLTDEVLERRPKGTRDFLLQTSILDRFCGPLCDAVTGQSGGRGTLERLEQANLFLIPLDDDRYWYRWHHLFAEVLRQRLLQAEQGQLTNLHRRAREWFEQNGLTDEAVKHGLAEGNFEQTARLIERIYDAKWQSGEIKTLQNWLAALPLESWHHTPRLWLVQAWAHMAAGEFEEAHRKLLGAETALKSSDEKSATRLRPEVMAFRASYASLVQEPEAVELAQEALQELPEDHWIRGMLVVFLANAFYSKGDLDAASRSLSQAPIAARRFHAYQPHDIHLLSLEGMIQLARGRLRDAAVLVDRALALAEPNGQPIRFSGTLLAYMSASLVMYEKNALDEVETYLTRCLAQSADLGPKEVEIFALSGLVRLCLARDDLAAAVKFNNQIDQMLWGRDFTANILAYPEYTRFQLCLKQGNIAAAAGWAEARSREPGPLNVYAFHRLALPQLFIVQGRFDLAISNLEDFIREAEAGNYVSMLIKALVLQAVAFRGDGKAGKAFSALEKALALAAPEGFVRHFIDEGEPMEHLLRQARLHDLFPEYVEMLLRAYSSAKAKSIAGEVLPEPLSKRELEVLQLVATGATNKEIAGQLFIAVSTVKKHVGNILVKLDTPNRVQAIARARDLDLLA